MRKNKIIALIISAMIFAADSYAKEEFHIPNEHTEACVGYWYVIMAQGDDGELKPIPEGKLALDLVAGGSGTQVKGERKIPIVWGAGIEGKFAIQWKQEDGKGDGIMGTWEAIEDGMKLTVREYENGKHAEGDFGVLILKRGKNSYPVAGINSVTSLRDFTP